MTEHCRHVAKLVVASISLLMLAGCSVPVRDDGPGLQAAPSPFQASQARCRIWMAGEAPGHHHPPVWSGHPGRMSPSGNCLELMAEMPYGAVMVRDR